MYFETNCLFESYSVPLWLVVLTIMATGLTKTENTTISDLIQIVSSSNLTLHRVWTQMLVSTFRTQSCQPLRPPLCDSSVDYNEQRDRLLSFLPHQMSLFCHHPSLLLHTHTRCTLASGSNVQGFIGLATCKALCNNTEEGAGYTVNVARTI